MLRIRMLFATALLAGLASLSLGAQNAASPASASAAQLSPGARDILISIHELGNQVQLPPLQPQTGRYQIQDNDSVQLTFTFPPNYNETAVVRPDGFITLIGAKAVYIAGQTLPEATKTVEQAYAGILHNPWVTVALSSFQQPYFVVGGQVNNPGKFTLHGALTATQAIAIAGGYTDTTPKDSRVLLLRRVSNGWVKAQVLDMKRMLNKGDISGDVALESGDLIFVPKNKLSKVQPYLPYFLPESAFAPNWQQTTY